jgi:hypothetical protein
LKDFKKLLKSFNNKDGRLHFVSPSSQKLSLHKAFQKQTKFAFGFFAPRLFTKASFRHSLETKNPSLRDRLCREEGIRTLDTVARIHTFQACSFNHSDTSLFIYFSFICSSILSLYSNGSFFQLLLYFTNIAIQIDLDKRINTGCNNITNAIEPNIQ